MRIPYLENHGIRLPGKLLLSPPVKSTWSCFRCVVCGGMDNMCSTLASKTLNTNKRKGRNIILSGGFVGFLMVIINLKSLESLPC